MGILTPRVVRWAAQECAWQMSGELSVWHMVEAWTYAHRYRSRLITREDVLQLGRLVEPRVNRNGLRTGGVRVGSDVKLAPGLVSAALDQLMTAPQLDGGAAVRWFQEYEDIHPFRDGNGRTGSILFNWLLRSLPEPVYPPNLWHDPRRDYPDLPL